MQDYQALFCISELIYACYVTTYNILHILIILIISDDYFKLWAYSLHKIFRAKFFEFKNSSLFV
jgi:hypothetical protein